MSETPPSRDESEGEGPEPDNVIALSRYRVQLSRGRRARRAEELFDSSDPSHAIRALPGDEFFYVLHELGFPDAIEVLQHGTPEQVRTALDFALWDRDQLSVDRADEWLGAMVEAPYETVGAWIQGLDIEMVALLFRKRMRVYDVSVEEPPDEPEGSMMNTPDRLFVLDLLGEGDEPRITARLVDSLYRHDQSFMRRVLVGTRSELDAELEELSFRWRSGRMADYGFVDFYEALEVYRELDPTTVQIGESGPAGARAATEREESNHLRVPMALAERLTTGTPFARAVGGITTAEEVGELHFALVALANRILSADRVTPGDDAAAGPVLARMAATLDIAVELLARGSEDRAVAAVRTIPLVRLFRLGVTLIGKVKKLGVALIRETPFAPLRPAVDIYEPDDAEVLAAVTRARPLFPRRLDTPSNIGERPFGSLGDLAIATAALERAAAAVTLVYGLGVRPDQLLPEALEANGLKDPAALDTALVARTVLVSALAGRRTAGFDAVPRTAVQKFKKEFMVASNDEAARGRLDAAARAVLTAAAPGGKLTAAMDAVVTRWIASLAPLEPVLVRAS